MLHKVSPERFVKAIAFAIFAVFLLSGVLMALQAKNHIAKEQTLKVRPSFSEYFDRCGPVGASQQYVDCLKQQTGAYQVVLDRFAGN